MTLDHKSSTDSLECRIDDNASAVALTDLNISICDCHESGVPHSEECVRVQERFAAMNSPAYKEHMRWMRDTFTFPPSLYERARRFFGCEPHYR